MDYGYSDRWDAAVKTDGMVKGKAAYAHKKATMWKGKRAAVVEQYDAWCHKGVDSEQLDHTRSIGPYLEGLVDDLALWEPIMKTMQMDRKNMERFVALVHSTRAFDYGRHMYREPNTLERVRRPLRGIIFVMSHSYEVQADNDPFVAMVDEAMEQFALCTATGAILANIFLLAHTPSWFPGAVVKNTAAAWRKTLDLVGRFHESYLQLIRRLLPMMPHPWINTVFFRTSGSEAVDKLVRTVTGRQNIIKMQGAYDGLTFGAMAVTKSKTIHSEGMHPLMPGVFTIPYPFWHQLGVPSDTPSSKISEMCLEQLFLLAQSTNPKDEPEVYGSLRVQAKASSPTTRVQKLSPDTALVLRQLSLSGHWPIVHPSQFSRKSTYFLVPSISEDPTFLATSARARSASSTSALAVLPAKATFDPQATAKIFIES
ncbi:hypothetical protein L227DRAFT_611376 [Lentinus tigrinus ALCF2SS1-6]|uniref:Cytochrome P450 n=1 Tax=Lentinus tigrinus ALCF2SS1-6 TaxID=1328759 RepID=A0A5C2SB07_9APHY|nr:hypothetical protein L227DRAFT_611376 [Lentinus tigrinus ALCF2SS1-6]